MKVKVTIEEIISQTFEVEVDNMETAYDQVKKQYDAGELVVDNATLIAANVMICDENEEQSDWLSLHVR